jgi:hypothetical protein
MKTDLNSNTEPTKTDVDAVYRLFGKKVHKMSAFTELAKIFHSENYVEFLEDENLAKYFINGLFNENENKKLVNEAIMNTIAYQEFYLKEAEYGFPLDEINCHENLVLENYKNCKLWGE